jgi:hypothetical protein
LKKMVASSPQKNPLNVNKNHHCKWILEL